MTLSIYAGFRALGHFWGGDNLLTARSVSGISFFDSGSILPNGKCLGMEIDIIPCQGKCFSGTQSRIENKGIGRGVPVS